MAAEVRLVGPAVTFGPARRSAFIGVLMYLAAAFLFAFNGALATLVMRAGIAPARFTELRNLGACIVLAGVLLVVNRSGFRVRRAEWRILAAYGVIAFAAVQFLYFFTISRLPLGIGTLLAYTAPVVVALWNRFGRNQHLPSRIRWAIVMTIIGLALVTQIWQGMTLDPVGLLAGFALPIALALYWLLGEAGQRNRDPLSLSMWGFAFATLTWSVIQPWWTFPWAVLGQSIGIDVGPASGVVVSTSAPAWSLMIWVILMGTIAPFLLVLGSLRRLGAQRAGIVGSSEPVWATGLSVVLLGATIAPWQLVGMAVVLAGIVIAETTRGDRDGAVRLPVGPNAEGAHRTLGQ